MGSIGGASVVGPILMGMRSAVNYTTPTATVEDIINLVDNQHAVITHAGKKLKLPIADLESYWLETGHRVR